MVPTQPGKLEKARNFEKEIQGLEKGRNFDSFGENLEKDLVNWILMISLV